MLLEQKTITRYKNELRKIADFFKEKYNSSLPLCVVNEAIDKAFMYFFKYEEKMKSCMETSKTSSKMDNVLDRHKIAAAFFCSIIKAKPLDYVPHKAAALKGRKRSDIELKKQANKECAYVFGLQIIQDFLNEKSINSVSPDEKKIYNNKIRLPEPHDDTYSQWFLKLITDRVIIHLDYKSKHFEEESVFFISHLYYMMESYSYQYYKAKLYESRSKKLS